MGPGRIGNVVAGAHACADPVGHAEHCRGVDGLGDLERVDQTQEIGRGLLLAHSLIISHLLFDVADSRDSPCHRRAPIRVSR